MYKSQPLYLILVVSIFCSLTSHTISHGGDDEDDDDASSLVRPTKSVKQQEERNKIPPESKEPQRLLIISLDGFRHDFLRIHSAPNLSRLAKEGVHAKSMTSSYVTKTFPNHLSIATGLYEETHGIIANKMYDPIFNDTFDHCSTPSCGRWYGGEPIWNTNELNNAAVQRRSRFRRHGGTAHTLTRASGVVYWPGSSSQINNRTVAHDVPWVNYKSPDYLNLSQRFDLILDWFMDKDRPINLGMVYSESPDDLCHIYGPESQEVKDKIKSIDDDIANLLEKMKTLKLTDINIIVLSDHGFADVSGFIHLEDCIPDIKEYVRNDTSSSAPITYLYPKTDAQRNELYKRITENCPGILAYKKEGKELQHYHYSNNRRISPIVLSTPFNGSSAKLVKIYKAENWTIKGMHGWNNSWDHMHATFIANGPAFKRGYERGAFENVNVYSLMCEVLSLSCPRTNGTLDNVRDMLYVENNTLVSMLTIILVCMFCALVSGCMIIGVCRRHNNSTNIQSIHSRNTAAFSLRTGPKQGEQSTLLETSDDEF